MIPDRIGLIVWLRSIKYARTLKRFGHVQYVSKRMKYAVLYCDEEHAEKTMKRLGMAHEVKFVEKSPRPFMKTDFSGSSGHPEKSHDFHPGFSN